MAIKLTTAKTPEEIDQVLKLRHTVFSEEEGKMGATPDRRILDRFDAYPTTTNLVAVAEDRVIGAMRITLDSGIGVPADEFYDFRAHLPTEYRLMSCGMYCITKPFRSTQINLNLLLLASYFGISHGVTHVVGPINPAIEKLTTRVGYKTLAGEITEPHSGLTILPVMLDVENLNDFFLEYAKKFQLHDFLRFYECIFYKPGEYVIRAGEQGDSAFIIVEGEAEVRLPESDKVVNVMGEGEIFGELALLTDQIRSADVIARTDLRVMTLEKSVFTHHLMENPEKALGLMQSMAQRMKRLK